MQSLPNTCAHAGDHYSRSTVVNPRPPATLDDETTSNSLRACPEIAAIVQPPKNTDEFEQSIKAWMPYIGARFRPFVPVWVAAIKRYEQELVSETTLKTMRGMMRRDVKEQADTLWNAKPSVIATWTKFYPVYVAQLIAEKASADPSFLLPGEDSQKAKAAKSTKDDTARKQALRDRELAARLFVHVHDHGGQIEWSPVALARTLSSKGGGPRVRPKRVTEAADTLVRLDVAHWRTRATSKQPWALRLTGQRAMPQRLVTLH